MLLGTLGANLSGNLLTGKEVKKSRTAGQWIMKATKGTTLAGQDS